METKSKSLKYPHRRKDIVQLQLVTQYWFRTTMCESEKWISIDDVVEIISSYYQICEMRFDRNYKSKRGWDLSDDDTLLTRRDSKEGATENVWILGDVEPFRDGVHCWRIQIKNPNKGWASIGAAPLNPNDDYNSRSFGGDYVWAIGFNSLVRICLSILEMKRILISVVLILGILRINR